MATVSRDAKPSSPQQPADETGERPARGWAGLVRDRAFGSYLAGKSLLAAGAWIHAVVAVMMAYELTRSASAAGIVSAAQMLPHLLLSPLSGRLTDGGLVGRQIVIGRVVSASGSAVLAVWIMLSGIGGLPGIGPIAVSCALVGVGLVISGPAVQSMVPGLVQPAELLPAVAMSGVPMVAAIAAGPALGTLITQTLGASAAFAVAATCSLTFAFFLPMMRLPHRRPLHETQDNTLRTALRYLRKDRSLVLLLAGIAAVGVGTEPVVTLVPALAAGIGHNPGLAGWMTAAFGTGALAGLLFTSTLRRRIGLIGLPVVGLLVMAAGLVAVAASANRSLVLLSFTLAGVGMALAFTAISTQVHSRTPHSLRGRINALWLVCFLGFRPIAAACIGALTDIASAGAALIVTSVLVIAAAVGASRITSSEAGS